MTSTWWGLAFQFVILIVCAINCACSIRGADSLGWLLLWLASLGVQSAIMGATMVRIALSRGAWKEGE